MASALFWTAGLLALAAGVVGLSLALQVEDRAPAEGSADAPLFYSRQATVDKLANCADCHYGIHVPFGVEALPGDGSVEVRVTNLYGNMTLRNLRVAAEPADGVVTTPPPKPPLIDGSEASPATPFRSPRELLTSLERVKGVRTDLAGSLAPGGSAEHRYEASAPGRLFVHLDGESPDNEGEEMLLVVVNPDNTRVAPLDARGDLRQAVIPDAAAGAYALQVTRSAGSRPLHNYTLQVTWYPAEVDYQDVLAAGESAVFEIPYENGTLPVIWVGVEPYHDHVPFEQPEPYDETNYTIALRPSRYDEPPPPAPPAPGPSEVLTEWERPLRLQYVPTQDGDVGFGLLTPPKGGSKFAWYLPPDRPVVNGTEELLVEISWTETPGFDGFGLRYSTPAFPHFLVPEADERTSASATYRIEVRPGWHDPPDADHWNWDFGAYVWETLNEPVVFEGDVRVRVTGLASGTVAQ